eukprot:NODE_11938_length_245_cov_54.107143_g10168_i0.p1 GENE.NODE_11938_length_245_cov_54.107143_g10168_i0~~NODE_11938_length_245_cov_54.107143_g10168_i0.p1  ORF type:complete len:50 (+),score=7.62 NODE_11938_length_245_cov_54.107143_g10168_i0:30-152(+)
MLVCFFFFFAMFRQATSPHFYIHRPLFSLLFSGLLNPLPY